MSNDLPYVERSVTNTTGQDQVYLDHRNQPIVIAAGETRTIKVSRDVSGLGRITPLLVEDSERDAFGRSRVSQPYVLAEHSFEYDLTPLFFEQKTATGGTIVHDPSRKCAVLSVTGTTGSRAILTQRQYNLYEKGKSQRIKMTASMGPRSANIRRRVGYFNSQNGLFFEQTVEGLSIVRRSSGNDYRVHSSSFNHDRLDGQGPSGLTFNDLTQQIFDIDFQFLGAGKVRFNLVIDGERILIHSLDHANRTIHPAPYMQMGTLPMRYEIENLGSGSPSSFYVFCCECESEGGSDNPSSFHFGVGNSADITATTSPACLISLRPRLLFGGVTNRVILRTLDISVLAGANPILVELIYGPTFSGGSWVDVNSLHSAAEYNLGATISGGTVIGGSFVPASQGLARQIGSFAINSIYPLVLDDSGANPIGLALRITTTTSTSATRGFLNWQEFR